MEIGGRTPLSCRRKRTLPCSVCERCNDSGHVALLKTMSSAYAAAMAREAERLANAQKRNVAAASSSAHLDEDDVDAKEAAWSAVFQAG